MPDNGVTMWQWGSFHCEEPDVDQWQYFKWTPVFATPKVPSYADNLPASIMQELFLLSVSDQNNWPGDNSDNGCNENYSSQRVSNIITE